MKNIFKFAVVSAALFLGACSKDAPDIQGGTEDLKYVVSSNVLNGQKESMELAYETPIVFVMVDSMAQVSVTMEGGSSVSCFLGACTVTGGVITPVRVRQSGDSVIVTPTLGTWTKAAYSLTLVGSFKSGVAASFEIGLTREPGLNLVSSNFWDVKNEVGYLEVPVSVDTLTLVFDQDIDSVEQFRLVASTGVEVATTTAIAGNVLTATIGVDSLEFKATYSVFYTVRTEAGLKASELDITPSVASDFLFQTAVTTFLPVSSNVKVLNTAVGEETYDFPLQDTLEVTFSENLNTDLRRLAWSASASTFRLGNNKGTGASGLIESNVIIDGATLRVVPVLPLTGVSNGSTVGFRVNVQAARDVNLSYTVEVQAYLRDNKLYVVSTNVLDSVGKYRPFTVTGDSLVVNFSKAVKAEGFKVNGFVGNYSVSWTADKMTATIKNIDTLDAGEYSDVTPYEYAPTTASTCKYGCAAAITFSAVADDDGMTYAPTFSGYSLQIHTEFDLSLVNANVLEGHLDATVPVANEGYKDSLNTLSNVVLTFNRALDTTLINAWIAKDAQTDKFGYIYQSNNGNLKIPATLSISADGRTLTLDPVEALPITKDGSISGTKIEYKVQLLQLEAAGLKTADGIASYVLGSTATDATKRYFKLPKTAVDISAFNVTKLLMKDTVYMVGNTNHPKYYDSLSSEATLGAYNGLALKVRIMHPSLSKDSVQYYQYRAQVINKASVSQGWFYATQQSLPAYRGLLDNAASLAAKASQAFSFTLLDGLKVHDLDGDGTEYTNGLDYFNQGSTIEIQVRGVRENDKDTSYTAWSNSITFKDNIAPCDPVHVSAANMNNTAAFGVAVARTVVQNGAAAAGSITYTFTFPEDMDVSMAPVITFKNTGSNDPVVNTAATKWNSARSYTAAFTLTAGINYSGVTYGIASVAGLKDVSGVAIVSSGSITVANDGIVTGIPSDGSSTIDYGPIALVAP